MIGVVSADTDGGTCQKEPVVKASPLQQCEVMGSTPIPFLLRV